MFKQINSTAKTISKIYEAEGWPKTLSYLYWLVALFVIVIINKLGGKTYVKKTRRRD